MKRVFFFFCFLHVCLPIGKSSFSYTDVPVISSAPDQWKQDMLNKVNLLRSKGCHCGRKYMPPVVVLKWNEKLEKSAQAHASDMFRNNFIGHSGSNGSSIGKRADRAGYQWMAVAENVAWGQETVEEVILSWKDSPGHCINMMSKSYRDFAAARQGMYWVQEFGRDMEK
jgi:uncharacterized protein YkwD